MYSTKMFCYNCMTLQKSAGKCSKCGTQYLINVSTKLKFPKNPKKSDYKELSYYLFYQFKNEVSEEKANKIEKVLESFPLKNDESFQNRFRELRIERNNLRYNNERPKSLFNGKITRVHNYGSFYNTDFLEPYSDYLNEITSFGSSEFTLTIGKKYFESELMNAMLYGIMELKPGEFFKIKKAFTNGLYKKTIPFKTKKDCREFEIMIIQDFQNNENFKNEFSKYIKNYNKILKMENRIFKKHPEYFI